MGVYFAKKETPVKLSLFESAKLAADGNLVQILQEEPPNGDSFLAWLQLGYSSALTTLIQQRNTKLHSRSNV